MLSLLSDHSSLKCRSYSFSVGGKVREGVRRERGRDGSKGTIEPFTFIWHHIVLFQPRIESVSLLYRGLGIFLSFLFLHIHSHDNSGNNNTALCRERWEELLSIQPYRREYINWKRRRESMCPLLPSIWCSFFFLLFLFSMQLSLQLTNHALILLLVLRSTVSIRVSTLIHYSINYIYPLFN